MRSLFPSLKNEYAEFVFFVVRGGHSPPKEFFPFKSLIFLYYCFVVADPSFSFAPYK